MNKFKNELKKAAEKEYAATWEAAMSSKAVKDSLIAHRMKAVGIEKVNGLIKAAETIIADNPIANADGELKVWRGRKQLFLPIAIRCLYELATGFVYASKQHKDEIATLEGMMSEYSAESLIASMGNPEYFTANHGVIVDAEPFDINGIVEAIRGIEYEMELVLDVTHESLEKAMTRGFAKAADQAEVAYKEFIALEATVEEVA